MPLTNNVFVAKFTNFWRRNSASITEDDPTFKTIYLGNTITQWAKGESSVDKPLSTLWRNYCQSTKPDIEMRVTLSVCGLKAVTRQHGLTEYWNYRLTYACAHPNFPKVFCWIYRHEGRRLKPELRCHAVLCTSESKAFLMQRCLRQRLYQALVDFRKEKQLSQNWRLSPISVLYPNAPPRNRCLSESTSNYRPPMERSRSAPRLVSIAEDTEGEMRAAAVDNCFLRLTPLSELLTSNTEQMEALDDNVQETTPLDSKHNDREIVGELVTGLATPAQGYSQPDEANDARNKTNILDMLSEVQDGVCSDRVNDQPRRNNAQFQQRSSLEEHQCAENPFPKSYISEQKEASINVESSTFSSNSDTLIFGECIESTEQLEGYVGNNAETFPEKIQEVGLGQAKMRQKQSDLEIFQCKCAKKELRHEKTSLACYIVSPQSSIEDSTPVCQRLYELSEQITDDILCDAEQCGDCANWLHMTGELDAASDSSSVPSDPLGRFTPDSPVSGVDSTSLTQLEGVSAVRRCCRLKLHTDSSWIDELEDGGASDESGYSEYRETIHVV